MPTLHGSMHFVNYVHAMQHLAQQAKLLLLLDYSTSLVYKAQIL